MLDPKDFPFLDSFEIEIAESWVELDTGQSTTRVITDLSQLGTVAPSFGEPVARNYNSINTEEFFRTSYESRKSERTTVRNYADTSRNPRSDDGRISRSITCKMKFKKQDIDPQNSQSENKKD